jgi:predicted permease
MTSSITPLLAGLFVILAIGVVLRRFVPANAPAVINPIIVHVTVPALLISVLSRMELDWSAARVLPATTIAQLAACGVALAVARAFKLSRPATGSAAMTATFCNTGFLGFPLILSLHPHDATAASTALMVDTFNTTILLWTAGVLLARRYGVAADDAPDRARASVLANLAGLVKLPLTWALVAGVVLHALDVQLPSFLDTTVDTLAKATSALVFLSLGLSLDLAALKGRLGALAANAGVKLFVMPAAALAVVLALGIRGTAGEIAVLDCAMPSAMVSVIISAEEGCDRAFAAGVAALTTLCCVATLPAVTFVWQRLSGG